MKPQQPIAEKDMTHITELQAAKEWCKEKRHSGILMPILSKHRTEVIGMQPSETELYIYRKEVIETWKYEYFKDGTWMGRTHSELFEIYRREVLQPEQTISEGETATTMADDGEVAKYKSALWRAHSELSNVIMLAKNHDADDNESGELILRDAEEFCDKIVDFIFNDNLIPGKWYSVERTENGYVGEVDTAQWFVNQSAKEEGWILSTSEHIYPKSYFRVLPSPQPDMSASHITPYLDESDFSQDVSNFLKEHEEAGICRKNVRTSTNLVKRNPQSDFLDKVKAMVEEEARDMSEKGLFGKYYIERVDGTPMNPDNKYFLLKLEGEGDPVHIEACRKAVTIYAKEVATHLPELSGDLLSRYAPDALSVTDEGKYSSDDMISFGKHCASISYGIGVITTVEKQFEVWKRKTE